MGETGLTEEELEELTARILANHTEPAWSVRLAWSIIGAGCLFMFALLLKAVGVF